MVLDPFGDTDHEDLPSYLTVRFAANNVPVGTVDLQDLSQFLIGLQKVLDAKVRHDFQTEYIESEQFKPYRFVLAGVRAGSVECDLVFNIFISAPSLVDGAAGVAGGILLAAFAKGVAEEAGKQMVVSAAKLAEGMNRPLRRYLADFLAFLRNVTSPNPTPVSSDLLERAEPGLRDMIQVGGKEAYEEGVAIQPDQSASGPLVFNRETKRRVLDLLEQDIAGDEAMTTSGKVTALDIEQNTFRVRDSLRPKLPVRCRYDEARQNEIIDVAQPPNLVIATGVPHYRKGSDRTWPPLYIKVQDVRKMPTLWDTQQSA